MAAEIDNPYCVVLEDTLQTDLLWSILGSGRVVFPMVIGAVAWSKANTKKEKKYNPKTRAREEIEVPIKYNEKVGTFTVPKANSIQTFSIKVRFLGETFGIVNQEQLQEAAENERRHARNKHDTNQTVATQDAERRRDEADMAEHNAETNLELANAPHEHRTAARLRRQNKTETDQRETAGRFENDNDDSDSEPFDEESTEAIALEKEKRKKQKDTQAKLDKKAALAHQSKLSDIRKVTADKALAEKQAKELAEAQQPAKPGLWSRGKDYGKGLFSRSKPAESGDKYKVEDEDVHVEVEDEDVHVPQNPPQPKLKPPSKPPLKVPAKPSKPLPKVPEGVRPASAANAGWGGKQQNSGDAGTEAFDDSWAKHEYDNLQSSSTVFARPSATVGPNGSPVSSRPRSRSPVRDPSSSRPAARLASADDIIIEPAFDKQSPRPPPSSQVPSDGIASHPSESKTRPPTKYDPFSQPAQNSSSLAVPDDSDGDFELQGSEPTSRRTTTASTTSVKTKRRLSQEGREKLDSLGTYLNNMPSQHGLKKLASFAPPDNPYIPKGRLEDSQAQPHKQQRRNRGPAELIQVRTPAEKKQAREAEAYARAIAPQDY